MEKIKIICVLGPTASGKTGLGISLAKLYNGEIVSADSMQIYKGAHIASAAADKEEMCGIKHHLLEFLPFDAPFTVYDYLEKARAVIADINSRGKLPIIVGGTGLYINALLDGIRLSPETAQSELRSELEAEYENKGGEYMLSALSKVDPRQAEKLSPNDKRRIVRALEIYKSTGKTKTELDILSKPATGDYDYIALGITASDRENLYNRINARVDMMMEKGLLEEARKAFMLKTDRTNGITQAIGHKEFFPYFEGETTLSEAVENLKRQTRRYAKRQLTWFNKRKDIKWLYFDTCDVLEEAKAILESEGKP